MFKGLFYILLVVVVGMIWWACSQSPIEVASSVIKKNRQTLEQVMKETGDASSAIEKNREALKQVMEETK